MAFLAPNMSLQSESLAHFLVVVLSRLVSQSVSPGAHSAKDWVVHNVPNIIGITSNNFFIISLVWVFIMYYFIIFLMVLQNAKFCLVDFWFLLFYHMYMIFDKFIFTTTVFTTPAGVR